MLTRIAPTPNGFLHLGNIYNFLIIDKMVKDLDGTLYLRIDDNDQQRFKKKYLYDIYESLEWLKINPKGTFFASEHFKECREALLSTPHYICECSRKEIKERTGGLLYDGHCRQKTLIYKPGVNCIRFNSQGVGPLGDFVLWQKEDFPSYQLSSVIMDKIMNVDTIIRGLDLESTSQSQKHLATYIGYDFPDGKNLIHHELIKDEEGEKLSKSDNALSFKNWRENKTPEDLEAFFKKTSMLQ